MRIALTHNLRLSDSEEEAEFDSRETIDALTTALERLGHRVERIEVSGPASRTAARLEAYAPDLVFNTAEGRRGRFREAFYPALFDELGFPYTGSDAWVLAVTLDKALTKLLLREHGVISPRGQFIEEVSGLKLEGWRFPVIVKPNFEGSSKGITQDSVVEDKQRLRALVEKQLQRFPAGVLVEEYIPGKDLTVAFLEKAPSQVLTPVEYVIEESELSKRRYRIYDYDLKSVHYDAVQVRCPADFAPWALERAQDMARKAYKALGVRDLGRIDFRVAEDGQVYFIEINALPSLEPGAGIYAAAALEGLHTDAVLGKVVESAVARWGLKDPRKPRSRPPHPRRPPAAPRPASRGLHLQRQAREAGAGRHPRRGGGVRCPRHYPGSARGHRGGGTRGHRPGSHPRSPGADRNHQARPGLQHGGGHQGPQSRVAGAVPARAARHPVLRLRSCRAQHCPRQGAGEEDRAPARHPHPRLLHHDHRQGAGPQGHELPDDREAGGGGQLQGRAC